MFIRKAILVSVILSLSILSLKSQNLTLSGVVKDASTGETLIGANVFIVNSSDGVITNNYGFYSLLLQPGKHIIGYSYIGYQGETDTVNLSTNLTKVLLLHQSITTLNEVTITKNRLVSSTSMSMIHVNLPQVKRIPSFTGEPDLIKGLQFLPGVQTSNEGTANFNVRGGSNDQNLILLDEAPVYNASHALGFYSIFNIDAIKSVTFYKGGFPAHYGGRLSSVVDITMKEGNSRKFEASGGIGLTASNITLQGPIIKEKLSCLVSARYSYVGQVANVLVGSVGRDLLQIWSLRNFGTGNDINFFDLNAKINYDLNARNHIYLSFYSGGDHFSSFALNGNNILDWGNRTSTLRWNHLFSQRLFSNTSLYYSNYHYSYSINESARNFIWNSNIKETGLKHDITYYWNLHNTITSGISIVYHYFSPGTITLNGGQSPVKPTSLEDRNAVEIAAYIANDQKITSKLSLNYGLRYSNYSLLGAGTVFSYNPAMTIVTDTTYYSKGSVMKFYQGIEPRVNLTFLLNEKNSIKASYNFVTQYLHQLSNSSIGLPTDTWVSPDFYIKPQTANQFVVGYYTSAFQNKLNVSFEGYYKILNNIIDYRDNADLFMNPKIETQILTGHGKSYGMECSIEKEEGKLTGWISFTLSETKHKIDGVNENKWYHPRYDIRHNFSVVANYALSSKWTFSTSFKLTSGGYVTLPEGTFIYNDVAFPYYSGRNGYALPLYHRLDIAAYFSPHKNINKHLKSQWVFSIYNVYFHKNVYALYVRQDDNTLNASNIYYMYLFGAVPTVTYNFKF